MYQEITPSKCRLGFPLTTIIHRSHKMKMTIIIMSHRIIIMSHQSKGQKRSRMESQTKMA